jgi:hypothetical protein
MCAVALLIAPVLGACGAGGDNGRATGAKGTYVAQVDPICKQLQPQVSDLGNDPAKQATAIADAVGKIMAVPRPKEDSDRAELFIAALNNVNLSLQDVDQSRMVNDKVRADKALAGAKVNATKATAAAKQYPMVECAQLF